MSSAPPLQTLPTPADSPGTSMRMSGQALWSKQPFQHSFLNWSTIAPRCPASSVLGGAATGWGCCLPLLMSALPRCSRSLSQDYLRDVPGRVNMRSAWAQAQPEWTFGLGSQNHPFLLGSAYGSTGFFVEKLISANLQATIQMLPLPTVVKALSCLMRSTRDWTIPIELFKI